MHVVRGEKEIRTQSFESIGKKYNVTGKTIQKWCFKIGLLHLKRQIKQISDEEWINI